MPKLLVTALFVVVLALACTSKSVASEGILIDRSKIPLEGNTASDFVTAGWVVEEKILGDLNGDASPDLALKLVQIDKQANNDSDFEQRRALVILFKNKNNKLQRLAVANRLLQCTSCGGAFYGFSTAPANVKIDKGILTVNQDRGSRVVTETTFRFRYDPKSQKIVLIGLDVITLDRATEETTESSTNFLTRVKITNQFEYNQQTDKNVLKSTIRKHIKSKEKLSIEQINYENY